MPDDTAANDIDAWIAMFRGPLIGLLASWGADWARAEELAQDTFAEAWLCHARFRGDAKDPAVVGPWLRSIAFHLHCTERRREARRRSEPIAAEVAAPQGIGDERREVLAMAFARLRPEQQAVLRMFYLEETSTAQVAALLGLTPKAVEGRLYQARNAMRLCIERELAKVRGGEPQ